MSVDFNSLLLAMGFAGACLVVTLLVTWVSARSESFMLTWVGGVTLIVIAVFLYSVYLRKPENLLAAAAFGLLMAGLSLLAGASTHFRTGKFPFRLVAVAVGVSAIAVTTPFLLGYDGLGFIAANIGAATLLVATGIGYWRGRAEAPLPLLTISILYVITGGTFLLCAGVLIADGDIVIGHAPVNWAEDISLLVSIAAVCGIGAMSLSLNQARLARSHLHDARTDMHTGLLNRRALFDTHGEAPLAPNTAVIVFDLDDFKGINDRYGHAAGDAVLTRFAAVLRSEIRAGDTAARIGGEEFAVVMPGTTPMQASVMAERVRGVFAAAMVETDGGRVSCTVSAGVAFAMDGRQQLERVIGRADSALYDAKRGGRNRVATDGFRRAG